MVKISYKGKSLRTGDLFLDKSEKIVPDVIGIKYGRLYNFYVVSESLIHGGLIENFNIGTITNWYDDLAVYIRNNHGIGFDQEAVALKSTRTEPDKHPRWDSGNYATNQFNFSVLPGGVRESNGDFVQLGEWAYIWNNERNSSQAWSAIYSNLDPYPMASYYNKRYGMSIRLVRPYVGGASDGTIIEQVYDYEGNIYNVVKIGNYAWTIENLKTRYYLDGTPIPKVTDNTEWSELITGAYCNYNNYED